MWRTHLREPVSPPEFMHATPGLSKQFWGWLKLGAWPTLPLPWGQLILIGIPRGL